MPKSFWLFAAVMVVLAGCSSIKIETGQTNEEAKESYGAMAGRVKSQWANQIQNASPKEAAMLVAELYDRTTYQYLEYGRKVAAQWREGEAGRGQTITDTEMRTMVTTWTETQKPLLKAYDDNFEYGIDRIKQSQYYGSALEAPLTELVEQYYKVYSVVFFPQGTVDDYEQELDRLTYDVSEVGSRFRDEVAKY